MKQIDEAQELICRLINDDYKGQNKDILRMMDLNTIASNLQQIRDRFDDIREAVKPLCSLGKSQSNHRQLEIGE